MNEDSNELVRRVHAEALELARNEVSPQPSHDSIDGLPDAEPGSPIAEEWDIFRREVEHLIREGCKGRFALVKAGQPITVWDSLRDAAQARQMVYGQAPSLVQEIQPFLRPLHARYQRVCRD